jgi:short-subunit dehydrogenase
MPSQAENALITGASGGIGYELAKLLARDHHNLVLVARSGDKLAQIASELQNQFGVTVKTVPLDLAAPAATKFLSDQLQREGVTVDILVNNAGFGAFGEFAQMREEEILGQIHLNVTALTYLTRLFLPPMLQRHQGKVMNVASTAGFVPGPLMAVYYATKAYVISFSEALANELRGSGVTVTCFCPGATHTGFAKRAGTENSRLFKQLGAMDVETVARDGYRAVMGGHTLAISGVHNWVVAESVRFAPRKMVTAVSRWIAGKVN